MSGQEVERKTAGKTTGKAAERIRERILSAVYPRRCPICDGILSDGEPFICRECAGKVRFIRGPVCMKCGAPLTGQQEYGADFRERQDFSTDGRRTEQQKSGAAGRNGGILSEMPDRTAYLCSGICAVSL